MKNLIVLISLLLSNNLHAMDIICQQVEGSQARMKFVFKDLQINSIALEDLSTGEFNELDKTIETVFSDSERRNFIVKNPTPKSIDWEKEPNCYKEIGTTWYFNLSETSSWVQFYPDIITRDTKCVPPRYRPQGIELRCH